MSPLFTFALAISFVPQLALAGSGESPGADLVAAYNVQLVNALKGGNGDARLMKDTKGHAWFLKARDAIKTAKIGQRLVTDGARICRLRGQGQTCWGPVYGGERVGIKFDGVEKTFYPEKAELRGFRNELNEFVNEARAEHPEATWLDTFLPKAFAAEAPFRATPDQINEAEAHLLFATAEGWRRLPQSRAAFTASAPDLIANWKSDFLARKKVECHYDRASGDYKGVLLELGAGVGGGKGAKVQPLGDGTYRVEKNGKIFNAQFRKPEVYTRPFHNYVKSENDCLEAKVELRRRGYTVVADQSREVGNAYSCSLDYKSSNLLVVPSVTMNLMTCEDTSCRTFGTPTWRDRASLLGSSGSEIGELGRIEAAILAKVPTARITADGFIASLDQSLYLPEVAPLEVPLRDDQRAKMSGRELSEYDAAYARKVDAHRKGIEVKKVEVAAKRDTDAAALEALRERWKAGTKNISFGSSNMSELEESMIQSRVASACCYDEKCRKAAYDKSKAASPSGEGVDLAPDANSAQ